LTEQNDLARDEDGWFVSSFTNGNASCVQVKFAGQGTVLVRDSKDRAASPVINMPSTGWAFLLKDISGKPA
jgi:uncharacterized protein DUF397